MYLPVCLHRTTKSSHVWPEVRVGLRGQDFTVHTKYMVQRHWNTKNTMKLNWYCRHITIHQRCLPEFLWCCQYKYFLSMIRNICCHKQSLTLSIIFDLKIYHKHWITIYYLYKSAWPLTVSQTVGVLTEAALPWLRGGFRQHVPSVNQLHF